MRTGRATRSTGRPSSHDGHAASRSTPPCAHWLGRSGVAELVERCCAHARTFAERLAAEPEVEVLNEVVLNQVLVRFGDSDERTKEVGRRVRESGEAWMSGTRWHDLDALRISVSNWQTTDADVERAVRAILQAVEDTRPAAVRG